MTSNPTTPETATVEVTQADKNLVRAIARLMRMPNLQGFDEAWQLAAHHRTRATRQDGLREALQKARDTIVQHHQWHAAQTDPDPEHGFIPADEYAESSLYERTVATLAEIDPFLRNGPRDTAALPCLVRAALAVQAIRPSNWDDADDPEQLAAWLALDAALSDSSTREESGADETLKEQEFNRGVLIAVSTLINCWGRGTETEHLLAMIDATPEMVEQMGFDNYDREPLLAALSASPEGEG